MSGYDSAGFQVVRGAISPADARQFATELARIAKLPVDDHSSVVNGQRDPYYRHGAVAATPGLWPLLTHPRLVTAASEFLRAPARCLPGIDTAGMHSSETDPHRDASAGELPSLAAHPYDSPYSVVRIILYPASPGQRFRLLPDSHRQPGKPSTLGATTNASWHWTTLRHGDALLFDPRLVHSGTPVTGPKPMVVLTYGTGRHALETYNHARIHTPELGFTDPPTELLDLLAHKGLLLEPTEGCPMASRPL